jgi:hypothetical protein
MGSAKMSKVGRTLLSAAVAPVLFFLSCGQRMAAAGTPEVVQGVDPVSPASTPAATTNVPAPAAPPVTNEVIRPAHSGTESEWIAAKAMLKFNGSMKMGGQEVVLINDKILRKGDTISVLFHEKEFKFVVTTISPKGVEYQRDLNP